MVPSSGRPAGILAALPAAEYPNTVTMLPILGSITSDGQFESGLGWLLDGLAAELGRAGDGAAGLPPAVAAEPSRQGRAGR